MNPGAAGQPEAARGAGNPNRNAGAPPTPRRRVRWQPLYTGWRLFRARMPMARSDDCARSLEDIFTLAPDAHQPLERVRIGPIANVRSSTQRLHAGALGFRMRGSHKTDSSATLRIVRRGTCSA